MSARQPAANAASRPDAEGVLQWASQRRAQIVPYALIVLLLAAAAIRTPGFVDPANLRSQLVLASYLGVLAGGQTLVILTGGIDLSVAWNLNLAAILLTQISGGSNSPGAFAIALGKASAKSHRMPR